MPAPNLDAFRAWMIKRGRSAGTASLYVSHLRACFNDKPITSRLITKKLSPNTKRTILAALRAYGKWAEDGDLLSTLSDLKLPAAARVVEKRPLERDEWDRILDAVELVSDQPFRAALRMICIRGFRVGDVCRMTRKQIDKALEQKTMTFEAKGERFIGWGTVLFEESLVELLASRNWNRVADLLAPGAGEEYRWRAARLNISRRFRFLEREAGLEKGSVTPHRMRRTYAVWFLKESGGDLAALQQHMGWASLNTALKYVDHARAEELDAIAVRMRERRP